MDKKPKNFNVVEKLRYKKVANKEIIPITNLDEGNNFTRESIIFKDEGLIKVFSRKCDHNNGKLCNKDGKVVCPLHGWEFDPESSSYTNVRLIKKEKDFEVESNNIIVSHNKEILQLPNSNKDLEIKVDLLSHASLLFSSDQFKFATDPWVQGFAFASGWWNSQEPPSNWKDQLNECDFIYISHNHPDHLNQFTLQEIRRDMLFVVPNFQSGSVLKILNALGFENVHCFEFDSCYQYRDSDLYFSILKSGDFRDDSGFYFTYGNFDCLSSVDSNDLNFSKFPIDITLYCSSFAGGASGYPLCFEAFSDDDKEKILLRNRNAIKQIVNNQIRLCNAKFFLPYAGFFKEKSARDSYIAKKNVKNSLIDYKKLLNKNTSSLISHDSHAFAGNTLVHSCHLPRKKNAHDNPEKFYKEVFSDIEISNDYTRLFFQNSKFFDNLKVFFELTNDDFQVTNRYFHVDFGGEDVQVSFERFDWSAIKENLDNEEMRYLRIKCREDAFNWVLKNNLPFEDLSIGFQCRIDRVPDSYNVKFWNHFTNNYIANS